MAARIGKLGVFGVWLIAILWLSGLAEWQPEFLFALIATILPVLALGAFILGVSIWQVARLVKALIRRQWRGAGVAGLALFLGVSSLFLGRIIADEIAIAWLGNDLVRVVERGEKVDGIEANRAAGFVMTGQMFFAIEGLAYDKTGQLEAMLAIEPDRRPDEFQNAMPSVLKCPGHARHIRGAWFKVALSMEDCA